jgi:hypothetical protein
MADRVYDRDINDGRHARYAFGLQRRIPAWSGVLVACAIAYVAVGTILLRPADFWSPDSAVRFVQVLSLEQSGGKDFSVPYPAARLDPEGRFFPFGPWFHFVHNGRQYLSYPPYFPVAVAPLHRVFGPAGLLVLPIAAGLAAVLVTWGVLRSKTPWLAAPAALALGVATPLLLYTTVFWDHSLTAALAAGTLALVVRALDEGDRPRPALLAWAGCSVGIGLWLRNEMYPFGAAVLLAWLWAADRDRLRGAAAFLAGLILAAGPVWVLNTYLVGSPLGWKAGGLVAGRITGVLQAAAGRQSIAWVIDKLGNAYYQLISLDYYAFNPGAVLVGIAFASALVATGVILRAGVARKSERLVMMGGVLGVFVAMVIIVARTNVSGLLPAAPFLVLTGLPGPLSRWERFLWGVVCVFTAAIIATGTHGGLQWGPRYLLPVLPALVWLAATGVARAWSACPKTRVALALAAGALVIASALLQGSGVDQVAQRVTGNARINAAVRAAPAAIVVTPLEWLTLNTGGVYFEKTLMLIKDPQDLHAIVIMLASQHVTRWTYIPFLGPFFNPREVAQWTETGTWKFSTFDDRTSAGLRLVTFIGR